MFHHGPGPGDFAPNSPLPAGLTKSAQPQQLLPFFLVHYWGCVCVTLADNRVLEEKSEDLHSNTNPATAVWRVHQLSSACICNAMLVKAQCC